MGAGDVASLAHPGGNVTGMTAINPELGAKRLQLLRELLPRATRFAIVWNPGDAAHALELDATIGLGVCTLTILVGLVGVLIRVPQTIGEILSAASVLVGYPFVYLLYEWVYHYAIDPRPARR